MNSDAAAISTPTSTSDTSDKTKLNLVFIHLDLGIGGAEQLVLSLASASQDLGHEVSIVTSRCDQDHCFSQVKLPHGRLAKNVHVWGKWIPPHVMGKAMAFCSTLRMLYLAFQTSRTFRNEKVDVIVLDVLPTPIPFLMHWWNSTRVPSVLFYCHFPDKLLVRDTVNGEPISPQQDQRFVLFHWYRQVLDKAEEITMGFADLLVVNSKFTQSQVTRVFGSLTQKLPMRVLYPALDVSKFDTEETTNTTTTSLPPIVSLNRFERKKNIELLLQAYAQLRKDLPDTSLPPLVIAGGYDVKNVENVLYMGELRTLAKELDIQPSFRPSISDKERSILLQTALVVVYTPHLEHFGIVPLEVMYAKRPVIACKSGGPMETVVHGKTGYLCEPTSHDFGQALKELVLNPRRATEMGLAGHDHVKTKFGVPAFQREWNQLLKETILQGKIRQGKPPPYLLSSSFFYLMEAIVMLVLAILTTWILRQTGVLAPNASIWGSVRNIIYRHDEL